MRQYINLENMEQELQNLYTKSLSEEDAAKYESIIEDCAYINAESICSDMAKYVHKSDTGICGNFCNIREDWDVTKDFVLSDVKPFGNFDDVIKSIDEETISEEDLEMFQTWCKDWFFTAFGTYNIVYNFQSMIAEMEYEEELEIA